MTNCCDYGCDQSPNCPARAERLTQCHVPCTPPRRRDCNELGVCQGHATACPGCTWQLAPGMIDGPYRRSPRFLTSERAAQIGKAALILVFLASLSATLGFATGYFDLMRWLP